MPVNEIYIVKATEQYLVAYKPAGVPTVPLANDNRGTPTLLDVVASMYPEVRTGYGRHAWEGSTMHRLDNDTSGLVLFARTLHAYQILHTMQVNRKFIKSYYAATLAKPNIEGFPRFPYPPITDGLWHQIQSSFRPFGPSQSSVRPLLGTHDRLYDTAVRCMGVNEEGHTMFQCTLARGFRHQIRSHLAWAGYPLVGDTVYAPAIDTSLRLIAYAIHFPCFDDSGSKERIVLDDIPSWCTVESTVGFGL